MSIEHVFTVNEADPSRDLRVLYATHAPEAGRLAYLLTGSREIAEDLVHEAFIKAGLRLAHLRNPGAFGPYLRQTIVNQCRSHWRREAVRRSFLLAAKEPEVVVQPDLEQHAQVVAALRLLPTRQRLAVVLRYYEDLTEEQTAEAIGCSTSAVKSLLHRAKEILRQELGGPHE